MEASLPGTWTLKRANYKIVGQGTNGRPLVLRDIGPWDEYPTVTNDAESVVQELLNSNKLAKGQTLLCYDSEGDLDELKHYGAKFTGFNVIRPE